MTDASIEVGRQQSLQDEVLPPYISIVRIYGPFLFITIDKLAEETADLHQFAQVVVLRLRNSAT